ncbi:MAG: hypothetical protein ACREP6_01345, partial [Candidatus Binataceae bacterium]
ALYAGMVIFGITMLFWIRADEIAWTGVFIFIPLVALAVHLLTRRDSYGDASAIARHLMDFPYEKGLPGWERPRPSRRAAKFEQTTI